MVIDSTGAVNPCAYYGGYGNFNPNVGDLSSQSIWEIWNNEAYRSLRRNMARGDLVAAGCANCYAIKEGLSLGLDYDKECDLEPSQNISPYARNIQILKEEISIGAEILKATPTIVSYTPSHRCNLRCIQCYQTSTRTQEFSREKADFEVAHLAPTLVRLIAGGGEPFLLAIWKSFLKEFDYSINPYLEFSTTTNATLIDGEIEGNLRRFKKISISVSIDAIGQKYEDIRCGAKWATTLKNIQRLKEITNEKLQSGSSLAITSCVMNSSILSLPDFVRFAINEGIGFGISPVVTMPPDENLICFNNKIEIEMSGWLEAIDESVSIVAKSEALNQQEKESYIKRFNLISELLQGACSKYGQSIHCRLHVPNSEELIASKKFLPPHILYIFPWGQKSGTAPFWAPLNSSGVAEVWLPAGKWCVSISNKWNNAGPTHRLGFVVPPGAGEFEAANIDVQPVSRTLRWIRRVTWDKEPIFTVARNAVQVMAKRLISFLGGGK